MCIRDRVVPAPAIRQAGQLVGEREVVELLEELCPGEGAADHVGEQREHPDVLGPERVLPGAVDLEDAGGVRVVPQRHDDERACTDAAAGFAPLFHRLLDEGIYLAPSAYEVGFLSAAHREADIDRLIEALRRS